jgi:hypothetical protein
VSSITDLQGLERTARLFAYPDPSPWTPVVWGEANAFGACFRFNPLGGFREMWKLVNFRITFLMGLSNDMKEKLKMTHTAITSKNGQITAPAKKPDQN